MTRGILQNGIDRLHQPLRLLVVGLALARILAGLAAAAHGSHRRWRRRKLSARALRLAWVLRGPPLALGALRRGGGQREQQHGDAGGELGWRSAVADKHDP